MSSSLKNRVPPSIRNLDIVATESDTNTDFVKNQPIDTSPITNPDITNDQLNISTYISETLTSVSPGSRPYIVGGYRPDYP